MANPNFDSSQPLSTGPPKTEYGRSYASFSAHSALSDTNKPPDKFLNPVGDRLQQGRLAQLVAQSKSLNQINRIFLAFLPPHLHEHAVLIASKPDVWVVQTDSSAWATRLRYVLPNLHKQMSDHLGKEIPPLRIRIIPSATPPAPTAPVRRLTVTEDTINLLEGTAESISDPGLSAALSRLARHAQKRRKQNTAL